MKNFIFTLALVFTFSGFQTWAASWDERLPLQSPEQKAEAFLKIRSLIPSLADGAVRYGFDPVKLFEHQLRIEDMLRSDSSFQALKGSPRELIEFKVFNSADGGTVSSDKVAAWKILVQNAEVTVALSGLNTNDQVATEIQKILQDPLLGKYQGITVGLSLLLPGNLKKEFFALPIQQKIELLQQHLPAEVISQGFSAARLGWTDSAITKEEIILRLQESHKLENKLGALLTYDYAQRSMTSAKEYLAAWSLEPNAKKVLDQTFNSTVAKSIPQVTVANAELSLVLREVPPVVSMFRGFAGNDCSTVCSFPFVNSPQEATFFVYDSKGGIKGYIQGTYVLSEGQKMLYLHTIAGPRISQSDTLNIMQTFVQQKKALQVADVVLPPMEKIDGLVNFLPIREAIRQVITTHSVPLQYQDAELRTQLKQAFNIVKTYDDASSNHLGFKINGDKLRTSLLIQQSEVPAISKADSSVDKNSLLLILLQMGKSYSANRAMIEALAPHSGISAKDLSDIILVSQNLPKVSSSLLMRQMEDTLKRFGFSFKEGYFKKNISLIARGLLSSPDVRQDKAFSEVVLLSLLEQREFDVVESHLKQNPGLFKSDRLSETFFRAFYTDVHDAEFKGSTALAEALKQNPKAILANADLLTMIAQAPKALVVLKQFLSTRSDWAQVVPRSVSAIVLADRNAKADMLSRYYRSLLRTRTDVDYDNVMSELNSEIHRRKVDSLYADLLKVELYSLTLEHYLKFSSKSSVNTMFFTLSRLMDKYEGTHRSLRKLLFEVISRSQAYQVRGHLEVAYKLKAKARSPEWIDQVVQEALLARSDRDAVLKGNPDLNKKFPGVRAESVRAGRCEGLFL